MRKTNRVLRLALGASAMMAGGLRVGGCSEYSQEFRQAATPMLRSGVNALLDGLVEGVFAVVEPEASSEGT